MLITKTEDGSFRARPMMVARADDDGRLWFVTRLESDVIEEVLADPQCGVTMQDFSTFLSMSGTCYTRRDEDMLNELWSKSFELWFNREEAVIIEFKGRDAEYWAGGLRGLKFLFEATRAVITGEKIRPSRVGDHSRIEIN